VQPGDGVEQVAVAPIEVQIRHEYDRLVSGCERRGHRFKGGIGQAVVDDGYFAVCYANRSVTSAARRLFLKNPRLRRPATSTGTRAIHAAGRDHVTVNEKRVQHIGLRTAEASYKA
jgi:hypothetical protein